MSIGIAYNPCKNCKENEKLTEENERLRADVADLQDELKCEKETNAHLCRQYMSENHLRHQAEEMLANGMSVVKSDTVRECREKIYRALAHYDHKDKFNKKVFLDALDQIAKEMLEGKG
jgi:predicted nuclease with TOPRIM domain